VAVANALFVDGSIGPRLRPDFLGVLRRRYGAPPRTVDFSGPSAVAAVNDWVAEQTRGRIERLFEQLGADTRLVLANAVYLKAVWTHQFPPELTRPELFSAPAGPVRAALMHLEGVQLPYDDGDGWQRVDLPYRGGELVLRLVLPRRPAASAEELRRLLPLLAGPRGGVARVDLALPRWDARTTLALVEPLARLGLVQAFGPGADFSAMSSVGLHVSDVRHVADVTVDERGTEAAAATGVAMAVSGTDRTATVRADRPFVWALVHTPTGVPVFTGHVVDPTLGRA
jgi:serpin B